MPALPSSVLEPLWVQIAALLPTRPDSHPLGGHLGHHRVVVGQRPAAAVEAAGAVLVAVLAAAAAGAVLVAAAPAGVAGRADLA